jgi:hydroxymethylglutaryl-CoA synthase
LAKSPEYRQLVEKRLLLLKLPLVKWAISIPALYLWDCCQHYLIMLVKIRISKVKKSDFLLTVADPNPKCLKPQLQPDWHKVIEDLELFKHLEQTQALDFETYEKLHKKELKVSVIQPKSEFAKDYIEKENPVLLGARYYNLFRV